MNLFATVLTYPAPRPIIGVRAKRTARSFKSSPTAVLSIQSSLLKPSGTPLRETLASYKLKDMPSNRSRLNDEDQLAVKFRRTIPIPTSTSTTSSSATSSPQVGRTERKSRRPSRKHEAPKNGFQFKRGLDLPHEFGQRDRTLPQ